MKFIILVNFVLFSVGIKAESDSSYPTVNTEDGLVRGLRLNSLLENVDYFAFRGIPYGEKPINELRFKPPRPVIPWKPATLTTFEYGNSCIQQSNIFMRGTQESEDCLYLNIFVPADIKTNEKLAVMFFIHGGGFAEGSSQNSLFGADFFIEQRVILVTINYRLGVFGFLSLDTPEYSGNMGLKDQQLALKWIHTNIDSFGGDNNRITIFGHSAGGASTHLHMLSAESRKYFQNAIPMSGTADNFWAISKENNHLALMRDVAKQAGEPKESFKQLIEFLKKVPTEILVENTPGINLDKTAQLFWTPIVERIDALQQFNFENPEEVYKNSEINVNSMFGFTSNEYLMMIAGMSDVSIVDSFVSNLSLQLPFRNYDDAKYSKDHERFVNMIREFYFDSGNYENSFEAFTYLMSDLNFAYFINKIAKVHAKSPNGKTFLYQFSVDSNLNFVKTNMKIKVSGSSHGDELCYLFRCDVMQAAYEKILANKDAEESKISLRTIKNITKLFANFAKYGNPSYNDEPVASIKPIYKEDVHFIDITNNGLFVDVNVNKKSNELWHDIEEKVRILINKAKVDREEL